MKGVIPWQANSTWPHAVRELEIDLEKTGLVMVDVQNYSEKNAAIVPQCARLRDFFHRNGLEVIYLRVGSLLPGRRDMHAKRALSWMKPPGDAPAMVVYPGTWNHDVVDELAPEPGELVIDKNSSGAIQLVGHRPLPPGDGPAKPGVLRGRHIPLRGQHRQGSGRPGVQRDPGGRRMHRPGAAQPLHNGAHLR